MPTGSSKWTDTKHSGACSESGIDSQRDGHYVSLSVFVFTYLVTIWSWLVDKDMGSPFIIINSTII